jgi:Schitoviridae exonuclease
MNQTYLNQTGVPLSVAVYLAVDHYEYIPNTISATALIKPVKQHILAKRVPKEMGGTDVLSFLKSRIGSAIHDGIEKAWTGEHYKKAMTALGYPNNVIERITVNPEHDPGPAEIPVYMEQRLFREFMGTTISGKFDFIAEGRLEDFKSTSTFTWVNNTKTEDYQLQGSIYRWLDRGKWITEDHMAIQFFFTDWKPGFAKADPKYPQRATEHQLIPLLSLNDTEDYIAGKLNQIEQLKGGAEADMPPCNDKELWRKEAVYKYYKDPNKRKRSTKNFDNVKEAHDRLVKDGSTGVVVEIPGAVVACKYCSAFPICAQKDIYIADGSLQLD